jgi:hypothetical protein
MGLLRPHREQKEPENNHMLTRTHHSSVIGRSASIRRMRRRSMSTKLYCGTNGCTSFLELQPELGRAVCLVCGFTRHIN